MLSTSLPGIIGASPTHHHELVFQRFGKNAASKFGMQARRANADDIEALHSLASNYIGGLASTDQIKSLQNRDPDSVWIFQRNGELKGGIGLLMLNETGANALFEGGLDRSTPQSAYLADPAEKPAAIYLWALLARGSAILGLFDLNQRCHGGRLSGVDLLATSRTLGGARAMRLFGFAPADANPNVGIMHRRELV